MNKSIVLMDNGIIHSDIRCSHWKGCKKSLQALWRKFFNSRKYGDTFVTTTSSSLAKWLSRCIVKIIASIASLMDVVAMAMLPPPEISWVNRSWMKVVSAAMLAAVDTVSAVTSGSTTGPVGLDLVDMMDAMLSRRLLGLARYLDRVLCVRGDF